MLLLILSTVLTIRPKGLFMNTLYPIVINNCRAYEGMYKAQIINTFIHSLKQIYTPGAIWS